MAPGTVLVVVGEIPANLETYSRTSIHKFPYLGHNRKIPHNKDKKFWSQLVLSIYFYH